MLDNIIEWSSLRKGLSNFDATTFYGIKKNYEKFKRFTSSQKYAIENVYFKWKIDKWVEARRNSS